MARTIGGCAVGEVARLHDAGVVALGLDCATAVDVLVDVFLVVLAVFLALGLSVHVGDDD